MPVAMELSRIIISEINDQQVIYLKEIDGATRRSVSPRRFA